MSNNERKMNASDVSIFTAKKMHPLKEVENKAMAGHPRKASKYPYMDMCCAGCACVS
jgi:hypothetical protein